MVPSVPAMMRLMLSLWRTTMTTVQRRAKSQSQGRWLWFTMQRMVKRQELVMDTRDIMWQQRKTTRAKTAVMPPPRGKLRNMKAKKQATPLPPRNRYSTGQQWPSTTPRPPMYAPRAQSMALFWMAIPHHLPRYAPRATPSRHLKASPQKVSTPHLVPKTRVMLEAPGLPLPCWRTSSCRNRLEYRTAVWKLPMK